MEFKLQRNTFNCDEGFLSMVPFNNHVGRHRGVLADSNSRVVPEGVVSSSSTTTTTISQNQQSHNLQASSAVLNFQPHYWRQQNYQHLLQQHQQPMMCLESLPVLVQPAGAGDVLRMETFPWVDSRGEEQEDPFPLAPIDFHPDHLVSSGGNGDFLLEHEMTGDEDDEDDSTTINTTSSPPTPAQDHVPCPDEPVSSSTAIITNEELSAALPVGFQPNAYTVIVGRGKIPRENLGNRRLRVLASTLVSEYGDATSRGVKTKVVRQLEDMVRNANGKFVRRDKNGRFFEVDSNVAREKIGYVFRDLVGMKYKSTSASKRAKRQQELLKDERFDAVNIPTTTCKSGFEEVSTKC